MESQNLNSQAIVLHHKHLLMAYSSSSFSSSYSSSSRNWVYDVFPSFSGEDVRKTFLSHFLKELDRKLIIAFKDNEIERSQSLDPELKRAIRESRISVVIFSKNYASSSWCLNELLEIVQCKEETGRFVIPVFYGLDPSHVRKQNGEFGKVFDKTCLNRTEDEKNLWRRALTDVANMLGYHSSNWENEAKMIEDIANDVLSKLSLTSSNDFEDFVGIEDHIADMSSLLRLDSDKVEMVGIWGSSGIGKTTIARALFTRISRHFQGSVFIDSAFISKCRKNYHKANLDDYNMKLHLQRSFLSEIFKKNDINMDHIGAMGERLKHHKLLVVLDDLDDHVVLDALAGQAQWFGRGTRIIAVTKDKHLLRAHGISCIYKVGLPSDKQALQMFCRFAFRQDSPPDGFMGLASEVKKLAGSLPLGLNVLGSYLRGRDKEDWMDMLPRLRNTLNGNIEKTLRVSYDGLDTKEDKVLFRHLACLFNGAEIDYINLILAYSGLDVNVGLKNLVDKSLIYIRRDTVEMHSLVQEMGKEVVRSQSNEPGEREFLLDPNDICDVLEDNTGTKKVLGISLDMSGIDELHIHKRAFEKMRNLYFLKVKKKPYKKVRWYIPEGFKYFPPKLKILIWKEYPLRCLPSNFCPQHLVKLKMQNNKLEKLWEGNHPLAHLKRMDLSGSKDLKEIPDLSMATSLERLLLTGCSSLVRITSTIGHLHKLLLLDMSWCTKLEALPSGINLKSLDRLNLRGCSQLKTFPDISSNISRLDLSRTTIQEFPINLHLEKLKTLTMKEINSQKLWTGAQPLTCLTTLDLSGSEKLQEVPDFSLAINMEWMNLGGCSSLVELPSPSIQNLKKLAYLSMEDCTKLEVLPTDLNLESLDCLNFGGCSSLRMFPNISRTSTSFALCSFFPSKRYLRDSDFSYADDLSFKEVCGGSTIQLLKFAEAIATGSRLPERFLKVLDVFDTMRNSIPEFESVVSYQFGLVLKNEAGTIWKRLVKAIIGIFMELENLIRHDSSKSGLPRGGVHPITRYVMNYLCVACRSMQTLEQVFEESNGVPSKDSTLLTVQMSWIMELLESNLEAKSKAYRDPALCYFFMMNNGSYIVKKVKDGDLGLLLGEDWIWKRNAKLRQDHMNYQKSSWNNLLGFLKVDNTAAGMNGLGKAMEEKLKIFNMQFDEICKAHSTWIVFDEQLREELRISLTRLLLPAYGNFIGRFQNLGDIGKNVDKYIKYGVEDIEARINDLFQGITTARK